MSTVVIAEDNRSLLSVLRDFVELAGRRAVCFTRAEEVLDYLAGGECSLLIIDALLPGMTGVELYRRVREARPDLDVIFAYGDDRFDFMVGEIVSHDPHSLSLKKPFSLFRLEAALA